LINLARLGLVGDSAAPEIARRAFENLTSELVDSEGPSVKNKHLRRLAIAALWLATPCAVMYAVLRLAASQKGLVELLQRLDVSRGQLSAFMMLWIGCFVGVVLSYGSRTTKMSMEDLIVTDADYLSPITRHLFAGTLAMILGLLMCLGAFEVKIAGISSAQLVSNPMIAFLIGTLLGVSELLLPGEVARRAGNVLGFKPSP
jgi:hypothetical protein